jgi:predicted  nucleic acid-binding Zn-ribbon protein
MNDRKLLEFIAAQVGVLTKDVADVTQEMAGRFDKLEGEIQSIKNDVIRLEHKVDENLGALYDFREQTNQALSRIEAEVTRHDEFIMRRMK